MGNNRSRVDAVLKIAQKVRDDYNQIIDSRGDANDESEDYSDAFGYIGTLFNWVSAEMLYDVYKSDDTDEQTAKDMLKMVEKARAEAEQALQDLEPFGFMLELENLS